jgi:hypothetical protein
MKRKEEMKKILLTFILLSPTIFSQQAHADVLITFKDHTSHVWTSHYQKGNEYCTMKEFGEYCVDKTDVASIKEVSSDTKGSEYGASAVGASGRSEQLDESIKALESLNCNQLRTANTAAAAEKYRNECMTKEQQDTWDQEQQRQESLRRQAAAEEQRIKAEEAQAKRQKEHESNAAEKPQRKSYR